MSFSLKSLKAPVNIFKSLKMVEIGFLVLFIIFIIFPFSIPDYLAVLIESPLGIITMFCITVFLFVYSNPILAVVYILVAYELLRRSSLATGRVILVNTDDGGVKDQQKQPGDRTIKTVPMTQKTDEVKTTAPKQTSTLEEEIVLFSIPTESTHEPPGVPENNFQPVSDNLIAGASLYN